MYPVTHVLPTVTLLNHVETLQTGQHAPSGVLWLMLIFMGFSLYQRVASMKCNGIEGSEASFILDSTALHRGYLLNYFLLESFCRFGYFIY